MSILREASVKIGAKSYTLTSDDIYLDYVAKGFEPEMVELYSTLAKGSDLIFDVGANIGCTAILFGEMAKQVIAFEPSPTTFSILEKNVQKSGLKNITLHNFGLGAEEGQFSLTFSPANRSGAFVSNQTQVDLGHTHETITIRALDDVMQRVQSRKLDFMKIDVEGFEGHVLRGAKKSLLAHKPIAVLELNHWCLSAFQRVAIPDFFDLLRANFPVVYAVDGNTYQDLNNLDDTYVTMYHHILHQRYPNVLVAFDKNQLKGFFAKYQHRFFQ